MMYPSNIKRHELLKSEEPQHPMTELMAVTLATTLQIVRDAANALGKGKVWINIKNGQRAESDIERLRGLGYNPSLTSDHFFGAPIPLHKYSKAKAKLLGDIYYLSTGAADITFGGAITTHEGFELMRDLHKQGKISFGQLIYEKRNGDWVHVSNDPKMFFSDVTVRIFSRPSGQVMYSLNNGKSYTILHVRSSKVPI